MQVLVFLYVYCFILVNYQVFRMTSIKSIVLHAYSIGDEPSVDIAPWSFPMQSIHAEINITYISVAGLAINDDAVSKQWIVGVRIVDYTLLLPFPTPSGIDFRWINVPTPKLWSKTHFSSPFLCSGVTFALVAKSCEVYARGTIFAL